MHYKYIQYETADGIGRMTLNRPEHLDAFNTQMHNELRSALDASEGDHSIRVILLTGSGRDFCAGQDLTERNSQDTELPMDLGKCLEKNYNPLVRRMRALAMPVICSVNGVAAGAGASLALSCDVIIAAKSASFNQSFIRIGLAPDCGSSYFLPRFVGEARARVLALTGDALEAETAEQWGLIWKMVPDKELEKCSIEMAMKLSKQAPRAMAEIKKLLQSSVDHNLYQQLDHERDVQHILGKTEDYMEGVLAFLEKRPAEFKGS